MNYSMNESNIQIFLQEIAKEGSIDREIARDRLRNLFPDEDPETTLRLMKKEKLIKFYGNNVKIEERGKETAAKEYTKIIRMKPLSTKEEEIKKDLQNKYVREEIVLGLGKLVESGITLDDAVEKLTDYYYNKMLKDPNYDKKFLWENEGKIKNVLIEIIWEKVNIRTVILGNSLLSKLVRKHFEK